MSCSGESRPCRLSSPKFAIVTLSGGVVALQLIEAKINSLGFKDCGASIDYIDCQQSLSDGVMVMVTGSLSNAGQSPRRFSQSFFLAPQPNGYYVLNDIFRYLGNSLLCFRTACLGAVTGLRRPRALRADTVPHLNSVSADDDEEPHAEAASVVGNTFVKQYYNLLLNKPSSLHRYYKDESSMTRCSESETVLGQRVRPRHGRLLASRQVS